MDTSRFRGAQYVVVFASALVAGSLSRAMPSDVAPAARATPPSGQRSGNGTSAAKPPGAQPPTLVASADLASGDLSRKVALLDNARATAPIDREPGYPFEPGPGAAILSTLALILFFVSRRV